MTDCPLSWRGQGHVSNFYILDLENVATASRCIGVVNKSRRRSASGLHVGRAECTSLLYTGRL